MRYWMPIVVMLLGVLLPVRSGADTSEPIVQVHGHACGVVRWAVKTGADADAHLVNLQRSTLTDITHLRSLPPPAALPAKQRIRSVEITVWSLSATITQAREMPDSDYRLVISDHAQHTMLASAVAPYCVSSASPFLPAIRRVRQQLNQHFHITRRQWIHLQQPVLLTGVGFFAAKNQQAGADPNGIELHPVLSLSFVTAQASPTLIPTATPSLSVTPLPVPSATPTATFLPTATLTAFPSAVSMTPTPAAPAPASVQVSAWVSTPVPTQNSTETVYGRITSNGQGIVGIPMDTTWSYKTVTSTCSGVTDSSGTASCSRSIGRATAGFLVTIQVTFTYNGQEYTATTGFTPQ